MFEHLQQQDTVIRAYLCTKNLPNMLSEHKIWTFKVNKKKKKNQNIGGYRLFSIT
jgi:hypothetical protein